MGIISLGKVENQKYLSCHHVDPLGSMEMVQYIYPHEWLKIIMGSMYLWDVQKFEKNWTAKYVEQIYTLKWCLPIWRDFSWCFIPWDQIVLKTHQRNKSEDFKGNYLV